METPRPVESDKEAQASAARVEIKNYFQRLVKIKSKELESFKRPSGKVKKFSFEQINRLEEEVALLRDTEVLLDKPSNLSEAGKQKIKEYFNNDLEQRARDLRDINIEKKKINPVFKEMHEEAQKRIQELVELVKEPGAEAMISHFQSADLANPYVAILRKESEARTEIKKAQDRVGLSEKLR